jgi:four helix bundle protein
MSIADCGISIAECGMNDLKDRTKAFALRIIKLTEALPKSRTSNVIGYQLLRCGTSVAANYRAVCRAKSKKDFIAKLGIVEEECDETNFWMELLSESDVVSEKRLSDLKMEAEEILKIIVASAKTARSRS